MGFFSIYYYSANDQIGDFDGEEDVDNEDTGSRFAIVGDGTARQSAEENKLKTKSDQVEALKKLGNVARCPFNREALKDPFAVGKGKLKNIERDRVTELAKEQRRLDIIYNSVTYFKQKAAKNLAELRSINERVWAGNRRELEQCEIDIHREIELFDYQAYLQGGR